MKFLYGAVIYHIRIDHTAKIHGGKAWSEDEIIYAITWDVRYRLFLCKNVRYSIKNRVLCSLWGSSFVFFFYKM